MRHFLHAKTDKQFIKRQIEFRRDIRRYYRLGIINDMRETYGTCTYIYMYNIYHSFGRTPTTVVVGFVENFYNIPSEIRN